MPAAHAGVGDRDAVAQVLGTSERLVALEQMRLQHRALDGALAERDFLAQALGWRQSVLRQHIQVLKGSR